MYLPASAGEGRFWKKRRAIEKKWRDPDDVYIDVEHREEERKKQGLPPRVGVLPHSAVAEQEEEEEEQRWEAQQERKKKRARKSKRRAGGPS